ncbi:hypothetical protein MNBD_ALPHA02-1328 [hydrothermal vent metagenome]|uniref:Methyltransferase type 11 domain-containing protein n=1 Tax=hydrothermal vent metagenome TaxID=652676 RepID=A0A3B0ST32_9ZZZZ
MTDTSLVLSHYEKPGLLDRILTGLEKMKLTPAQATVEILGPVDEFHIRGAGATADLVNMLDVDAKAHVLDAGSGLGGPARRLASMRGCRVTGIDLTTEYCDVAETLTEWTGLSECVSFRQGDVTDMSNTQNATYDAAWTIHVGMNIADRRGFYSEIARVLKPGARFIIYDIFSTGKGEIEFPVPWAEAAAASHLFTIDEVKTTLEAVGFTITGEQDDTDAGIAFITKGLKTTMAAGQPMALGLHLVPGPKTPVMIANVQKNLADGLISLNILICEKPRGAQS